MVEAIDRADAERAALLVFILETPGGLVDSTRTIVTRMLAAKTPVAVFVAPSGARAASAGFLITIAADVAAMAPGTHIGAAHPVSGQGEKMDETMAKKAASDVAAYARTLALGPRAQRRVGRAGRAREPRVHRDRGAERDAAAHRSRRHGRARPAASSSTAARSGASTGARRRCGRPARASSRSTMSLRQRVLSTLAHPNIAYILLSLGVLGLTIELWSPGAVLPGVVGGICLLLAFFTFQVLPVNYAGVLLILFGLVLLVLEIKVASFGLLGAGGVVSLLLGSMILIDAPTPELRVSLGLIIPVVVGALGDPAVPRAPGGHRAAPAVGDGRRRAWWARPARR